MDEWFDIPGYEGKYIINSKGVVRSLKNNKGNPCNVILKHRNGTYPFVVLYMNGKRKTSSIHRLLAIAFIPNPENKSQVNHKDGDKWNFNLENLEWCTPQENIRHAIKMGLNVGPKNRARLFGKDNPNAKPVKQLDRVSGEVISRFDSLSGAVRGLGYGCVSVIGRCANKKIKTAYGFHWVWAEEEN